MKSETISVQQLFQDRRQYRVPFFQRAYVWNREDQWERLWDDISVKAEARLDGPQAPAHFLGAAVLEPQQRSGLLGVETSNIIDGQQRFTTLQYVLAALAIILRHEQQTALLSLVESCLWNGNADTMQQPHIEMFKVWPTFRDRDDFQLALKATNLDELRLRFPQSFTQTGTLKRVGHHAHALEAIWYFAEEIREWISAGNDGQRVRRINAISEAILRDLQLVSISLGEEDDAQVIFETLNGHGAQLHATDLIRNFIFMRAERDGDGSEGTQLYHTFWTQFEGAFWTEEQRRGRLSNPRIEWFLQTALQSVLGDEVEIGRLYVNYRRFAFPKEAPIKAREQLQILDANAKNYQQLISGVGNDPIAAFGRRVAAWDASTTHALALRIASSGLVPTAQAQMYNCIASYLARRAMCGLTTKNYNKIFVQLLKKLSAGLSAESLRTALADLEGDASRWPRDEEFKKAWLGEQVYPGRLDASRIKAVLAELEAGLRSARSEEPLPGNLDNLDVDHILPISWFDFWPLPDGTQGQQSEANSAYVAFLSGAALSDRQLAIRRREEAKATLGNLTLAHYGINRGLHNYAFLTKREKFFEVSNLHLNRSLMRLDKWDEDAIAARAQTLFDVAVRLWGGP
jgi:hypothetical protein